jgi:hypothetical protein
VLHVEKKKESRARGGRRKEGNNEGDGGNKKKARLTQRHRHMHGWQNRENAVKLM